MRYGKSRPAGTAGARTARPRSYRARKKEPGISPACKTQYAQFLAWLDGEGLDVKKRTASPGNLEEYKIAVAAFEAAMKDIDKLRVFSGAVGTAVVARSLDPTAVAVTIRLFPNSIFVSSRRVQAKDGNLTQLDT